MKFKRYLLLSLLSLSLGCAFAYNTREEVMADLDKAGGVYYAYPADKADNTPAPKGYKPFYISHLGRHGSRYLISDNDYERVASLLRKAKAAGALAAEGERLLADMDSLMLETRGRGGDLTPLGARQHHDIARRMIANYPQVFKGNARVDARSTLVLRCALSMAAFCEGLKEVNPRLQVSRESSQRWMPVICPGNDHSGWFRSDKGWWAQASRKFSASKTHPERLVKAVFSDDTFVERYVNPSEFIWSVYWLAADAQNVETRLDFKKYLTPEEMYSLWEASNADFYARHADYPANEGVIKEVKPLLRDFVERADKAIAGEGEAATLRFAHDGQIVPFTAFIGLEGATGRADRPEDFADVWRTWEVSPMAANVQMVFFRNPACPDDVLVKVLHNEKESRLPVATTLFPYYKWSDLRPYFIRLLED